MKYGRIILALCLSLSLCAGIATQAAAEGDAFSIGILQLVEHPALDAAGEGFLDALADNGFVDGENLRVDLQNPSGDAATLQLMAQQLQGGGYDLYLGIATDAVQALSAQIADAPILGTAVTDYVASGLIAEVDAPGINVSGTTDMNPIDQQIDLLMQLVPDAKTIGICYTSSEVNSQVQAEVATQEAEARGLTVIVKTISAVGEVQQAIDSFVGQVDALYLPTDNIVASAMSIVSDVAIPAGIPVIGGEENMLTGGALATVGLNYYNLGYQTGMMALRILNDGANPAEMPIEALTDTALVINMDTANAIGLEIPAELAEVAQVVGTEAAE